MAFSPDLLAVGESLSSVILVSRFKVTKVTKYIKIVMIMSMIVIPHHRHFAKNVLSSGFDNI